MLRGIFQPKPLGAILASAEAPETALKRTLGPVQLTLLGIGAIIGAGIFSTVGTAAAGGGDHLGAGPALVLSFVITAITCGFAALCYAEFASMVPISGSAYTYAYATLGELIGWIIGWDLIIEYAVGNVAVAISWAGYFQELLRTCAPRSSRPTRRRRRGPPGSTRPPWATPWRRGRAPWRRRRTSAACRSSSTFRPSSSSCW